MDDIFEKKARMTEQDVAALKSAFEDNPNAVIALRKIFYPELTADAPIMLNNDMMTNVPMSDLTPEQKVIKVEARQMLVQHVEGSLNVIRTLIGKKTETAEQVLKRLQQDSAK